MDIKKFGELLRDEVKDALGIAYNVELKEVIKNNGVVYHGLSIKEGGINVVPVVYIESYFETYKRGASIEKIKDSIVKGLREFSVHREIDASFFTDFSKVAPMLCFRLVNSKTNEKRLMNIPIRKFEDLSLVPVCNLETAALKGGTITITRDHLKLWEVSENELWENIFDNAASVLPPKVRLMGEIVKNHLPFINNTPAEHLLVVSNKEEHYGASVILYPDFLMNLAGRLEDDLYIIPSSVHETIIIPACMLMMLPEEMVNMIGEVNECALKAEDVLSSNLYYFCRSTGELCMWKDKDQQVAVSV